MEFFAQFWTKVVVVSEQSYFGLVSKSAGNKTLNLSFDCSKNSKSQTYIETNSDQARPDSVVIAHKAVLFENLRAAIYESLVFFRFFTLHFGFNNVNWIVAHWWAKTGKNSREKVHQHPSVWVLFKESLCVLKDYESNTLVRRLLKESCKYSLIHST